MGLREYWRPVSLSQFVAVMLLVGFVCLMYYYELNVFEMFGVTLVVLLVLYGIVNLMFKDFNLGRILGENNLGNIFEDTNGYFVENPHMYHDYPIVYGEITSKGVERVCKMAQEKGIRTFIDMGCGVGKSVIVARLVGMQECVGVEVVTSRYMQAEQVRAKLPKEIKAGVTFVEGDMFEYDIARHQERVLVFASNLVWDWETNEGFFKMVGERCQPGSMVVSSLYREEWDKAGKLKYITTVSVPMSWDKQSKCVVLEVV